MAERGSLESASEMMTVELVQDGLKTSPIFQMS